MEEKIGGYVSKIIFNNGTQINLKEDDIIVKGIVALNEISLESINNNYEEKMVIKSVDTFDFGNLKHWQVGGA